MRSWIISATLLLATCLVSASPFLAHRRKAFQSSGYTPPGSPTETETFDTNPGYDLTGWVEGGTTPNEDDASPVISGLSLNCVAAAFAESYTYQPVSSTSDCEIEFGIYLAAIPANGDKMIFSFNDVSVAKLLTVKVETSGAITIYHGTDSASTTTTLSATTWYRLKVTYVAGSGSNGTGSVEIIAVDGNFDDAADNDRASVSAGTSTGACLYFMLGQNGEFENDALDWNYDEVYFTAN